MASQLFFLLITGISLSASAVAAGSADSADSRTVVGASNSALAEGAEALRNGEGARGVELTLQGLAVAQGWRERQAALSNLCGGYILLEKEQDAISYCDTALEENDRNWRAYSNRALAYMRLGRFDEAAADIEQGEALAPHARSLKVVKSLLLDETQPVEPTITIDDRRQADADEK